MIDIDALKRDKRPQSAWVVHALIDRLEAAEKDNALKEKLIDRLALELNSTSLKRDALRAKIEAMGRQEPVGWFARIDGDEPLMECKHADISRVPLYLAPGAKGE